MGLNKKHKVLMSVLGGTLIICIILITVIATCRDVQSRKDSASAITESYAYELQRDFNRCIAVSETVAEWVADSKGNTEGFDAIARRLCRGSVVQIEIAPGGVITQGYPNNSVAASPASVFQDAKVKKVFEYASDHKKTVISGPINHPETGRSISVITPVFIHDGQGNEDRFWGYTIVIVKIPSIYSHTMRMLSSSGYNYCLDSTITPDSSSFKQIETSMPKGIKLKDPVGHGFDAGQCKWMINVTPKEGWISKERTVAVFLICFTVGTFIMFVLYRLFSNMENDERLREMSYCDSLTGLLNRNGLMSSLDEMTGKSDGLPLTMAILDIDDFKLINDLYGHAAGDQALKHLALLLKKNLPQDAVLGRTGGDEFCVIIPGKTADQCTSVIENLIQEAVSFSYKDKTIPFSISAGYAAYPDQASDRAELLVMADEALYSSKLTGKHVAKCYDPAMPPIKREQLGFNAKTLAAGIPGSLLVRRADKEGRILFANDNMLKLLNCKDMDELQEYSGLNYHNLIAPEDHDRVINSIWYHEGESSKDSEYFDGFIEYGIITRDGQTKPIVSMRRLVHDEHLGDVFFILIRDIDTVEERTKGYDDLTGMPNFNHFMQYAPEGIRSLRDQGEDPVIIYFDYSNFKMYNNQYGFYAGDQMICGLGNTLRARMGEEQSARIESDHFIVYGKRSGIEDKIKDIFALIQRLPEMKPGIWIRAGIYLYNDASVTLEDACDRARLACVSLRGKMESDFVFFNDSIQEEAGMKEYVLKNFNRAISQRWIEVWYQPVIRSLTGTLCGVEALARWNDPFHGMISPGVFVPALEDAGIVDQLDLYVFEELCRSYGQRLRAGEELVPASFNLSRIDFQRDDMVDQIEYLSKKYKVPRDMTNIEITESAFVEDTQRIADAVNQFHQRGYQVWMDDFGTGYSSLGILKDVHFDEIKIDMSFLSSNSKESRSIIEATVRMAKNIGIQTLAEGVETEEQFLFMRKIGCEKIQGYYFGMPMPAEDVRLHCMKKDIREETARWRNYYDAMGRLDFLTGEPMCLIEDDGKNFNLIFSNEAFESVLRKDGYSSSEEWTKMLRENNSPVVSFLRQFADQKLRKQDGNHTISYPSGDHYMQMGGKLVAACSGHYLYQGTIQHVEIQQDKLNQRKADYLQNLFYMCNDVALLNYSDDTVTGLKSSLAVQPIGRGQSIRGIAGVMEEWNRICVYPEDRKRFREYSDAETLRKRVADSKDHILTGYFRSKNYKGEYNWLMHLVFPVPGREQEELMYVTVNGGFNIDSVVETLKTIEPDVIASLEKNGANGEVKSGISNSTLWKNLMAEAPGKYFWKDLDHRYLGASRNFLDYYGLDSEEDIIGKTDGEMGWYVEDDNIRELENELIQSGVPAFGIKNTTIRQGRLRPILVDKMPVYVDGKIQGVMGFFEDTEYLLNFVDSKINTATIDPVTGLSNGRGIAEGMEKYLKAYQQNNKDFALMRVYIREYSTFCSLYGEEAGDVLLHEIGKVLTGIRASEAVFGRLADSQFFIVKQFRDSDEISELAADIHRGINDLHQAGQWKCTCTAQITVSFVTEETSTDNLYERMIHKLMTDFGKSEEL